MIRLRSAAFALLALGCRSSLSAPLEPPAQAPAAVKSAGVATQARPPAQDLPEGWATVPLEGFGALLDRSFPALERRTLAPSAFEELSGALRAEDPLALRALLLLARCSDPLAGEILLQRLERRAAPSGELGPALDIAAARAARAFPESRNAAGRLESLAYGKRPHPDLEVRVECACTALHFGRDQAIPFLLAIQKHGTRLMVASSGWKPIADMDVCQRRAAEALCERAGRPCRFRPLQPLAERESDIRALEVQLSQRKN